MGFAGSSRLDERRRRRLATGPGETERRSTLRFDQAHLAGGPYGQACDESPLGVLAPKSSWPMILVTAVSGILAVVLVFAAFRFDRDDVWGPVLGVTAGQSLKFASALAAFVIAQLSLVVYWYRRQSRKDFAGRYRRWLTAALFAFAACAAFGTNVHETLATVLCRMLPPTAWNTPTVCWTVPVGVIGAFLGPSIFRELRAFGVSSILFCFGAMAATLVIALALIGNVALPAQQRAVCSQVGTLIACWSFLNAFWWHVRHVVRVSNEPPPSGQLRAELKRLIPQVRIKGKSSDKANKEVSDGPQPAKRRRRASTGDDESGEPAAETATVTSPSIFVRIPKLAASIVAHPFRRFSSGWSTWRSKRRELALQRSEEKQLRKQEQLASAKAAREEKEAAAAAKAESRRQAAEKKREAKRAANIEQPASNAKKQPERTASLKNETDDSYEGQNRKADGEQPAEKKETAAERRAARKARRAERNRVKSESLMPAELLEAIDDDQQDERPSRNEKRKRRKNRR